MKKMPKKNTMPERKSFPKKNRNVRKTFQTKSLLYCLNNYYATSSHGAYPAYLVFCGAGPDERTLHFCCSSIAATPTIANFGQIFRKNEFIQYAKDYEYIFKTLMQISS